MIPDITTCPEPAAVNSVNNLTEPVEILSEGLAQITGPVALASSFSMEDIVLIDMLQNIDHKVRVFAIDTGRLNEETYDIAETIRLRYRIEIDWFFPDQNMVEQLERSKGLFSFRESIENRHECCYIRKVEPLQRALKDLAGWITGQRRQHGVTRHDLLPLEKDQANGNILKLNPLTHWDEEQAKEYIKERQLPINRLFHMGYRSIGCAPCSRAVQAGEDPRSGRWWWENPEHKECGLHRK